MQNTKEIFNILPSSIQNTMGDIKNISDLQEIRIKVNKPLIYQVGNEEVVHRYTPTLEDLKIILQRMSNFSMYAFEEELKQGYITIKGGHRVGICGSFVVEDNKIKTIKDIASLNIRVCKEIKGCSNKVIPFIVKDNMILNTIIISPPKCGKTTMIRDIARNVSEGINNINLKGKKVCIVDERSEIGGAFFGVPQMEIGMRTDLLDNCPKSQGIMMAIRSMAPEVIICDEIGTYKDMESILMALNSGVSIITTIHGYGIEDLYKRAVFREIIENNVFSRAIILSSLSGAGTIEYMYDFEKNEKIWRR